MENAVSVGTVASEPVALNLLSTKELVSRAGLKDYEFTYIQRKFGALLIPGAIVGGCMFWTPGTVELVKSLRAQVRPQAKAAQRTRKGKGKRRG